MHTIPPLPPAFNIAAEFPISTCYAFFNHACASSIARRRNAW